MSYLTLTQSQSFLNDVQSAVRVSARCLKGKLQQIDGSPLGSYRSLSSIFHISFLDNVTVTVTITTMLLIVTAPLTITIDMGDTRS